MEGEGLFFKVKAFCHMHEHTILSHGSLSICSRFEIVIKEDPRVMRLYHVIILELCDWSDL